MRPVSLTSVAYRHMSRVSKTLSGLLSPVGIAGPTRAVAFIGIAAALAGCAQQPNQRISSRSKEYFPESIYGPASARVVGEGEAVPRGGGQYLVGRPYT